MSIVRMGMSEDSKFADGYEAIFKKKAAKPTEKKPEAKPAKAAKKPAKKK